MIKVIAVVAVRTWWMPEHTDAMFGAAVGGGIALLTAILTNRNARKRQKIELQHQAVEREKERQHALKRETYIPIAEAATDAVAFVAQLPTIAADQLRTMAPLNELGRLASRSGLISPPAVQEALSKFHRQLQKIAMELVLERLAIEDVAGEIESAGLGIQIRLNRQREVQLRVEKHTDEGTGNMALVKGLIDESRHANEEATKLAMHQQALTAKKTQLEIALQKKAVEALLPVSELGQAVITAIRSDLGLPPNMEWLQKFSREAVADVSASLRSFHERFEKRAEEARKRENAGGGS